MSKGNNDQAENEMREEELKEEERRRMKCGKKGERKWNGEWAWNEREVIEVTKADETWSENIIENKMKKSSKEMKYQWK